MFGAALCGNRNKGSKNIRLDNLNFIYFNARSLNNKFEDLHALLETNEYDAVFVTETWLKSWHKDPFICNDLNYFILRTDRHDKEHGGGVCALIKLEFSSKINHLHSISIDKEFDILVFDWVFRRDLTKRFVLSYLPPDSSKELHIVEKFVQKLDSFMSYSNTYVLGDFNYNVSWKKGKSFQKRHTKEFSCFYDFLSRNNLNQLVSEPTHKTGSTLDLVCAPSNNNVTKVNVEGQFAETCDHLMINVVLNIEHDRSCDERVKKNFYKADYFKINKFLQEQDWNSLLVSDDIEELYDVFVKIIQRSIDAYVPDQILTNKRRIPKHLKSLFLKKKKLYKNSKTSAAAKEQYQKAEKLYKQLSKKHRDSVEQQVLSSGSTKRFFDFVNKRLKSRGFIPPLVNPQNVSVVTDSVEKADLLNSYFSKTFQQDDEDISHVHLPNLEIGLDMPHVYVEQEDIRFAIRNLKSSVSKTPEDIPALYVKRTLTNLLLPLGIIYNKSLRQGKVPSLWKRAIVIPLHKKGIRSMPSNYRPVSMTSVFSRLLESILSRKITDHLTRNNLLSRMQHGFMKRRNTSTNQLLMLDVLTQNFDKNIQTDLILLDFSKAFDVVPHTKLFSVLHCYGIEGRVVHWIKNLLYSRTQQTLVDGRLSESCNVLSGVPQGSVIGPLLFNVYLNNLLQKLEILPDVKFFAFADDIKILSNKYEQLEKALQVVDEWCNIFKLKLNPSKSEYLSFKMRTEHRYFICSELINKVSRTKDLGIWITDQLTWSTHIAKVKSKATCLSFIILRSFRSKSIQSYMLAYKTYVRPILEHNSVIWNGCNIGDIKELEKVQKMFTKILLQRHNIKFSNYHERLQILNLHSLESRRMHIDLITVYKIMNNLIDLSFEQFFSPISSSYNFRRHKFALRKSTNVNNNTLLNYFRIRVINNWNSLPSDIVCSESLAIFKNKLKRTPII